MVRVRGVFGVLAAATLFLSVSLPSASAVAQYTQYTQYIPNEPVAPLERNVESNAPARSEEVNGRRAREGRDAGIRR